MSIGNKGAFLQSAILLPVAGIPSALVIAPHPDDESLGCGGTIALLCKAGVPVTVLFVSDGSMSHPGSKKYPAESRVLLREREAMNALQILGVEAGAVRFMRLKDAAVPLHNAPGFDEGVRLMREEIGAVQPAVLFMPWRRDPHKDHRATAAIVNEALATHPLPVRVLEYFVWLWERSGPEDLPAEEEVWIRRVDIASVTEQKRLAVMAHVSQVTNLIDDDPDGFRLSPDMLAHFWDRYEFFAEAKPV